METLSIIVPVYNIENYLGACVASILAQTRPPDELVLVNDGSTDRSGALCDALAARHPQITVVHTPNQGVAAARCRGLQASTGTLIGFVDGDDIIHPAMYRKLAAILAQTCTRIACCGYRHIQEQPEISPEDTTVRVLEGSERFVALTRDPMVQPSLANKLYRRTLFDPPPDWMVDMRHFEDLALNYLLFSRAPRVARCSTEYYYYRQHPSSAAHNWNGAKLVDDRLAAARVFFALAAEDPGLLPAAASTHNEALLYLYTQLARRGKRKLAQEEQSALHRLREGIRNARNPIRKDPALTLPFKTAAVLISHAPALFGLIARASRPRQWNKP